VSRENTGSQVWADSACRSRKDERWLAERMLTSRIHRSKPAGKPMPPATAWANAKKSPIRTVVEHLFSHQKIRVGSSSAPLALPAPSLGEADAGQ